MNRESVRKSIVDNLVVYRKYWDFYSDTFDALRVINLISHENEDEYYEYFLCVTDEVAAIKGRDIEKVLTSTGGEALYPLAKIKVDAASSKTKVTCV